MAHNVITPRKRGSLRTTPRALGFLPELDGKIHRKHQETIYLMDFDGKNHGFPVEVSLFHPSIDRSAVADFLAQAARHDSPLEESRCPGRKVRWAWRWQRCIETMVIKQNVVSTIQMHVNVYCIFLLYIHKHIYIYININTHIS